MKQLFVITALLSMIALSGLSHAEKIYQWTDKDGAVHFSDRPPADPDANDGVKTMQGIERSPIIEDGTQNMETEPKNGVQENPPPRIPEESGEEQHQIQETAEEEATEAIEEEIEEETPAYLEMYRLEDLRTREERKEDREERRQIRDYKRIREK